MNDQFSNMSHVTIQELPQVVQDLFALTNHELLPGSTRPWRLFVRYLRRKPGRGLAVIYHASEILSHHQRASANSRAISLTIEERALTGSSIHITAEQARNTPLEQPANGLVRATNLGVSLQAFPTDSALPTLAACCTTTADSPLLPHLHKAACLLLANENWFLLTAQAVPIRYKPASRCVIRYDLTLAHPEAQDQTRVISLFGKVYADQEQAQAVQHSTQQLYTEQQSQQAGTTAGQASAPFLPRPLLCVEDLSLLLSEAVQAHTPNGALRTGTRALHPQVVRERGGKTVAQEPPIDELHLAARALARLHTSGIGLGVYMGKVTPLRVRTSLQETKRAYERAALLSGYYPALAADIQDLAQSLAQGLESFQPETYRPAHGGFKASQLLYHDNAVSLVDFDGLCLADPALDVGYFLAYLRPSGLWYKRQGTRAWLEAASDIFTLAYASALQELGVSPEETTSILQRSHLYTAALLFKIATRRVNRLNSPRTHELAGMLKEIATCLALSRRTE